MLVKALGTRSFVPNWFLNFPLLQWELRSRAFLLPSPYVFYFNFIVSIKPLNDTSAPNSYVSVNFSVFFFSFFSNFSVFIQLLLHCSRVGCIGTILLPFHTFAGNDENASLIAIL